MIPPGVPHKVIFLWGMHKRAKAPGKHLSLLAWAEDRRDLPGFEEVTAWLEKREGSLPRK